MDPLRSFVRRRRFSTFVLLTFVLTWLPWLTVAWMLRTGRPPVVTTLVLIGGFGPFLAAVLVAAATAAVATVIEFVPPYGLDNLTVPILTALFYYGVFV